MFTFTLDAMPQLVQNGFVNVMMNVSQSEGILDARELWRVRNRSALSEIAGDLGVSYQSVRRVLLGIHASRDLRIERALHARGCPGFDGIEAQAA